MCIKRTRRMTLLKRFVLIAAIRSSIVLCLLPAFIGSVGAQDNAAGCSEGIRGILGVEMQRVTPKGSSDYKAEWDKSVTVSLSCPISFNSDSTLSHLLFESSIHIPSGVGFDLMYRPAAAGSTLLFGFGIEYKFSGLSIEYEKGSKPGGERLMDQLFAGINAGYQYRHLQCMLTVRHSMGSLIMLGAGIRYVFYE